MDVTNEIKQYFKYLTDRSKHHAKLSQELYRTNSGDELKLRECIYQDGIKQGHIADALAFKAMFRGVLNDTDEHERKGD